MAWQPTIPQAGDLLTQSQADIQGNFAELNTILQPTATGPTINMAHVNAPSPAVPPVNTWQMYTTTLGLAEHLHLKSPAGDVIPFTSALANATGFTYLPSGIILKWGTVNASHGGTAVVFATAFPTACISVQLTAIQNGGANSFISVLNVAVGGFNAYSSTRTGGASNTNCYYLAIGY